jgi:GNAT superfamily N-acetyltransferase
MNPEGNLRQAASSDVPTLLELQAAYYEEDGYPFSANEARSAWKRFLSDDTLGRAWVIQAESVVVGYVVLTLGYSFEYRGRDAFVDELYVIAESRGRGLGRKALGVVESYATRLGVRALHLEVERNKKNANRLYRSWGFVDHERYLMTKRLGGLFEHVDVEQADAEGHGRAD